MYCDPHVPFGNKKSRKNVLNTISVSQKNRKIGINQLQKPKNNEEKISNLVLLKSSLLYQIKEFFNNSTLHGVRYIAETGRPFIEKFMWFCFTSVGAVSALIIIFSLWEKFQTNPTITGLDTDFHNSKIIFPVITVCPTKGFDEDKLNSTINDLNVNQNDEDNFIGFFENLPHMTYNNMDTINNFLMRIQNKDQLSLKSLREYIFEVGISCESLFDVCQYKEKPITCCEHFVPVLIEHGYCFAFNSRYIDTPDSEKINKNINDVYETDKEWALNFALTMNAKVFLHDNEENLGLDFDYLFIYDKTDTVDVLVSMSQTYTTEDARQLSISQRKCIFPNERKLKYSKEDYTFTGCMRDCRIDIVLKFCKCVPPFYKPSKAYKYCTIKDIECLSNHASNITNMRLCNHCELCCYNTVYDIEKLNEGFSSSSKPKISINYLSWPIVRYKREVLFGWVDLLVSFGGIAGLFLGFSLLSGVEIVYYFTMRAICMLFKNRRELYQIEQEKRSRPRDKYDLSLIPEFRQTRRASMPSNLKEAEANAIPHPEINKTGLTFMGPSRLVGYKKSRAWDKNRSMLRVNNKLDNISPMEINSRLHYRSISHDKFAYMP